MKFVPIFQEHVSNVHWDLEQLLDCGGTLVLTLIGDHDRQKKIVFDSYVAYRKLDEGDALLMLAIMRETGGTAKCFYQVEDSDFVAWFNKERCSDGVTGSVVRHYAVAATNDIVDVLSIGPPVVEDV
jgi:hypothetical protein